MIRSSRPTILQLLFPLVLLAPLPAAAQLRAELVASGFARPVGLAADPSTPDTLLVLEQGGIIKAAVAGVTRPTPFLDLSAEVKNLDEQGLLGLAIAADGQRVFVSWVKRRTPDLGIGDTVVSRYRRSAADPLVLDPATRFDLIWPGNLPLIAQPTAVHKGGHMAFGPDGFLYIGLGDGGSGGTPEYNAQHPGTLLGKMIRIDVNVPDSDPRGYRVPADNPFLDGTPVQALGEIWSFGFRNPWRWSFDDFGTGATGAIVIGDVGQDSREEIDFEPYRRSGRNYGWYMREGTIPTPGVAPDRAPAYLPLTEPLADYPRTVGRAITGGYVYRGTALPPFYRGRYFVADFFGGVYSLSLSFDANGEARVADVLDHTQELGAPRLVPTFGRDLSGELYFSSNIGGRIFRIAADATAVPAPPANFTATVSGSSVRLAWQPSPGAPALGYQLEAGSAAGLSDLLISETPGTGLSVPAVPPGLYFVRVRAGNAAGLSAPSAERTVRVGCGGPQIVPGNLTGSAAAGGSVTLNWSAVSEASGYLIEAGSGPGLTNLASIPVGAVASVSGLVPAGTYYVRVRAVTPCWVTTASNEIVVSVP